MKSKAKESLYVKTLLWVYSKSYIGFTKDEMRMDLKISDEEWPWIEWSFFNALAGSPPLVWSITQDYFPENSGYKFGDKFYPSSAGTAAAIDYLELKEAQKSGKTAFRTAIAAITISIGIGILQILLTQNVKVISIPEIKPLEIGRGTIQAEIINFPGLQDVRVRNEFLKTQTID